MKTIVDLDMNKIIHDSGHKLDWYGGGNKDLVALLNKQLILTPELNIDELKRFAFYSDT